MTQADADGASAGETDKARIARLEAELTRVREEKDQVESLLAIANEHADAVEAEVRTKHAEVQHLLDASGEGVLAFGTDLCCDHGYSRACVTLLGRVPEGHAIDSLLYPDQDPASADRAVLRRALLRAFAETDATRREAYLSLLPEEVTVNGRCLHLRPTFTADGRIMLMLSDLTRQRELEDQLARDNERLHRIVDAAADPVTFRRVLDDVRAAVARWTDPESWLGSRVRPDDLAAVRKETHTLKGLVGQIRFDATAEALHGMEHGLGALRARATAVAASDLRALARDHDLESALGHDLAPIRATLGDAFLESNATVAVPEGTLHQVTEALEAAATHDLAPDARTHVETAQRHMHRLCAIDLAAALRAHGRSAERLAQRDGKSVHPVSVEGGGMSLDAEATRPFVRSLVHVVRNAVAHGIEDPATRQAAGKPSTGEVCCEVARTDDSIAVVIRDDGAGLDTTALGDDAGDAAAALFAEGTSTRAAATEAAGHGIGMAAVKTALDALGGDIEIATTPGEGTRFVFRIPDAYLVAVPADR